MSFSLVVVSVATGLSHVNCRNGQVLDHLRQVGERLQKLGALDRCEAVWGAAGFTDTLLVGPEESVDLA